MKKKEKKEKRSLRKIFSNPFESTKLKADKTLTDAEMFIKDSHTVIKIGAIIFATSMGLSMLSSVISIRLGMKALKENKTREEVMLWNLMKKYADKA